MLSCALMHTGSEASLYFTPFMSSAGMKLRHLPQLAEENQIQWVGCCLTEMLSVVC